MKTTVKQVEKELRAFTEPLANKWLNDELAKLKIAKSYDAWMHDVNDHHMPFTLREHIETCLDDPRYISDYINNPAE